MFNFNIQRFASDGAMYTSSGEWVAAYFTETVDFVYIPAGIEFEGSEGMGYTTVQRVDDPVTYAIKGVSSATGDSSTVTVTLSGELSAVTVSDTGTVNVQYEATVSGGDMTTLSVIVGGTTYAVNSSGKLYIPEPAEDTGTVISTAVVNRLKRANGKVITQNLNYINPEAADSDIALAITALNSLSQNTKEEIVRVNRTVIG